MILDELSDEEAVTRLRDCCGSDRWVKAMVASRPFQTAQRTRATADRIWNGLSRGDWLEAFAHHPRIGETRAAVVQSQAGVALSSKEQSASASGSDAVKDQLARVNDDYERRFGYIYIVCATGKSAEELLATALTRLNNDSDDELRTAAEEQRKIMQLRLAKLLETT